MKQDTIKVISFDIFDTLIYFQKSNWMQFFSGFEYSTDELLTFQEIMRRSVIKNEPLELLLEETSVFSQGFIDGFSANIDREISSMQIFPDVAETLAVLKERGYKIACVSNLAYDFGIPALEITRAHFDYVVFSYEVGYRKPDAEIFSELVRQAGCHPAHIVHIGDKLKNDYQGALDAGLQAIHLSRTKSEQPGVTTIRDLNILKNMFL